jgi:hypothetical protein
VQRGLHGRAKQHGKRFAGAGNRLESRKEISLSKKTKIFYNLK